MILIVLYHPQIHTHFSTMIIIFKKFCNFLNKKYLKIPTWLEDPIIQKAKWIVCIVYLLWYNSQDIRAEGIQIPGCWFIATI